MKTCDLICDLFSILLGLTLVRLFTWRVSILNLLPMNNLSKANFLQGIFKMWPNLYFFEIFAIIIFETT